MYLRVPTFRRDYSSPCVKPCSCDIVIMDACVSFVEICIYKYGFVYLYLYKLSDIT